jgi:hypothetical protein
LRTVLLRLSTILLGLSTVLLRLSPILLGRSAILLRLSPILLGWSAILLFLSTVLIWLHSISVITIRICFRIWLAFLSLAIWICIWRLDLLHLLLSTTLIWCCCLNRTFSCCFLHPRQGLHLSRCWRNLISWEITCEVKIIFNWYLIFTWPDQMPTNVPRACLAKNVQRLVCNFKFAV